MEGTEDMKLWLHTKMEEDRRRQQEERTYQATLVLERGVDIDSGGGRRLSPDGGTRSLDELIIGFWVVGELVPPSGLNRLPPPLSMSTPLPPLPAGWEGTEDMKIEGQGSSCGRDLVFVLADSWVSVVTFVRLDGFEDAYAIQSVADLLAT
jgi:hypothetical protein